MSIRSVHIVRRYGPVGGMERYVWELTHSLVKLGQPVTVICEQIVTQTSDAQTQPHDERIQVIVLGKIQAKPRWISMLRFSHRVTRARHLLPQEPLIIHSHERSAIHHVTSFHGPSILSRKRRWTDLFSPRIQVWEYLEKREICGDGVKAVLPNSTMIANQLRASYTSMGDRIREPVYPGVGKAFYSADSRPKQKIIGFIGREWRRKGLPFAAKVVAAARLEDPEIKFKIAGCDPNEVVHLFKNWDGGYELLGWCEPEKFYRQIDLLLLPSKAEPFGMVVAEANASHVPVVISDQCGIATLIKPSQGAVYPIEDTQSNIHTWARECRVKLDQHSAIPKLGLTWEDLAEQHRDLYANLHATISGAP